MRALRVTGSFAQRGDVLGCNCRCLHDGSWPLRHRREKRIGRGEDDDDLEQRHPSICNTITTGDEALHCKLDTLATTCSSAVVGQPPPRAVRRHFRTPLSSGRERSLRGALASALQAASRLAAAKKKSRDCSAASAATSRGTKNSNSYERATNEQKAVRSAHCLSLPSQKGQKGDKHRRT